MFARMQALGSVAECAVLITQSRDDIQDVTHTLVMSSYGGAGGSTPPRRKNWYQRLSHDGKVSIWLTLVVAVLGASSAPWWWKYTPLGDEGPPPGVIGFSGGCDAFQVFAQNRWNPYGTAVRAAPNVTSKKVGGFAPNESIAVDGWVHSRPAYPTNTAPWNNDVWFHLADQAGWVSFAGVRATPVSQDPTGLSKNGGPPAPTNGKCEGAPS